MLNEAILAGLLSLPTFHEDRAPELADAKLAQYESLAAAIAPAAKAQRVARPAEWAALMIAIGAAETNFSLRIQRGECRWEKRECDAAMVKGERVFRARGPWQTHAYGEAATAWDRMIGVENTSAQVMVASSRLQRGYYTCRGSSDWFVATVNGYAGRRCSLVWPGLEQRAATYRRVLRVIEGSMRTQRDKSPTLSQK